MEDQELLRDWIESQLTADLAHYNISETVIFDWSQSYGTGRKVRYLDGTLENFSRIILFNKSGDLLADGCMDFIFGNGIAICYWDIVTVWKAGQMRDEKKEVGIPFHIWKQLPDGLMSKYLPKVVH